jgi:ATP-dependent DNA ligase
MAFITPMFAAPSPKTGGYAFVSTGVWYAEEKFDGIRLIIEVQRDVPEDLLSPHCIRTWSRDGLPHAVPRHLRECLAKLPTGIYDGELFVPGKRSYGTLRLSEQANQRITVFDVLEINGQTTRDLAYIDRRHLLEAIFTHRELVPVETHLSLAVAVLVQSEQDVTTLRDALWAQDREGLILKNGKSLYLSNSRRKNTWIKVKDLRSDVLTVTGFEPSRGEIVDRGPYAMVTLRDDEGNITQVKTRNDRELDRLEKAAIAGSKHPWIGRQLRIEYQERTPDGSYRHPRWDRWEDE